MATPHSVGIAALIKEKSPRLSPAAIASALATTAYFVDKQRNPLLAQNPFNNASVDLGPATPFDFGGGAVNPTGALDPGLVFDAGGSPFGITTYFSIFDMVMLSANKAGVFVAQAAGNLGPSHQTIPWIYSLAASVRDRTYPNSLTLGNNAMVQGTGLANGTLGRDMYDMILASSALEDDASTLQDSSDCQDSSLFKAAAVKGKVLICTFGLDCVMGGSSMSNVIATTKNLCAVGVVMLATGDFEDQFSIPPTPFQIPAIILLSTNGTKTVLDCYNSAPNFTATVRILEGAEVQPSSSQSCKILIKRT